MRRLRVQRFPTMRRWLRLGDGDVVFEVRVMAFLELTMPQREDFSSEIEFARAMQRWALTDVPHSNPQRLVCVNDWFAEEILLTDEHEVHNQHPERSAGAALVHQEKCVEEMTATVLPQKTEET